MNAEEGFSTTIDIHSAQQLCATTTYESPTFPHPAYRQFMEIVIKHCLSDSAGNELLNWFNKYQMDPLTIIPANTKQGCTLLNLINIPHILYNKIVIMEYNSREYVLH